MRRRRDGQAAHAAPSKRPFRFAGSTREIRPGCHGSSHLVGQTGTVGPGQVDDEFLLGEVFALATPKHMGHQSASGLRRDPGQGIPPQGVAWGQAAGVVPLLKG